LDLAVGTCLGVESFRRNGVNLVNEDDSRGIFAGKAENISDHMRPFTLTLLDELTSNDVNKCGAGMMCNGFDEYRFPGPL
jgi:hypothetical protein